MGGETGEVAFEARMELLKAKIDKRNQLETELIQILPEKNTGEYNKKYTDLWWNWEQAKGDVDSEIKELLAPKIMNKLEN